MRGEWPGFCVPMRSGVWTYGRGLPVSNRYDQNGEPFALVPPTLTRGLSVHTLAQRHGGQLLVRRLLLIEIRSEQSNNIVPAEGFRPSDHCAVTRDLVVLDGLGGADDGR